jgi:hypothetical protein
VLAMQQGVGRGIDVIHIPPDLGHDLQQQ